MSKVEAKTLDWLAAGCRMVLVVAPATQTVHVYRSNERIQVLDMNAVLDGDDVVPGWNITVAELFA